MVSFTRLIFGTGHIIVGIAHPPDSDLDNTLALAEQDQSYPIGDEVPNSKGRNTIEISNGNVVELTFNKIESVDVVIEALNRIKENLKAEIK